MIRRRVIVRGLVQGVFFRDSTRRLAQRHGVAGWVANRADGAVVSYEQFAGLTPGRRIRNVMRFAHTGEVLGVAGQTIAGVVSLGAVVLVWTGLALAFRRCGAWLRRRSRAPAPSQARRSAA